ncbi:MAG: hypothetical protein IT389_15205 [Nitrospira sp.]|nr:hypothetical protein [Nitrospira sp.]
MSRWFSLSSLCLSSLTLISCGNGLSPFASNTDPCSLLTPAEAERALGEPAQEGQRADATTCVFKSARDSANAVTVQVDETPGKDRRSGFNKDRLRRDSVLVAGLGDGAIRIDSPPSLSRLTFLRGENLVTVMVSSIHASNLPASVMAIGKSAAERYGATVAIAQIPPASSSPIAETASSTSNRQAGAPSLLRASSVAATQTRPVSETDSTGPAKSSAIDASALVGTWQTYALQGTTKHHYLLVIEPNRSWTLSSLTQFDGVLDAESGRWSLDRANTFKGQSWKGTYVTGQPDSFVTTGSLHSTWTRLDGDQPPKKIPAELWTLRNNTSSVPVFQLKSVDRALVGTWESTGTYAGGPATFVWTIKPSAATDLFIMDQTRGTVITKSGLAQLQPTQKRQRSLGIVAAQEGGFTTSDGKSSLRWTRHQPPPETPQPL